MDLDDEELLYTRILNRTASADEMFEKLGYRKENRKHAEVFIRDAKYITRQLGFNTLTNNIMINVNYITMQELQAINKKVKELGWI